MDLKLNGTGGEVAKPEQPDVQGQESFEGSFRYDALKDADVNNLVSDSRPTLITLFGISECGKTTFVGSLFAILRRRPSLLMKTFIDSDTLTGFERRVHQRFLSEDGRPGHILSADGRPQLKNKHTNTRPNYRPITQKSKGIMTLLPCSRPLNASVLRLSHDHFQRFVSRRTGVFVIFDWDAVLV